MTGHYDGFSSDAEKRLNCMRAEHCQGASSTELDRQQKKTCRLDLIFVLTLGLKIRSELADRRCVCFLAGVSSENSECKYDGCVDESAW